MPFYNKYTDRTNFVISFTSNPKADFDIFAKGYAIAASRLACLLIDSSRFSDYEAYPIMFLYRHALELYLKHIIYSSAKLAAFKNLNDIYQVLFNTHDLIQLSRRVKVLLGKIFPDDKKLMEAVDNIEVICNEFSEIDPCSYSYRYPIDKKGNHSTSVHQVVNLRSVEEKMSQLLEDLDNISFGLNMEIDIAEEVLEDIKNLFSSFKKEESSN